MKILIDVADDYFASIGELDEFYKNIRKYPFIKDCKIVFNKVELCRVKPEMINYFDFNKRG